MIHIYRCDCGWEIERNIPISEQPPEEIADFGDHPAGPPGESRELCYGTLRRVWVAPIVNMGYRPGFTSRTDEFRFKNLPK